MMGIRRMRTRRGRRRMRTKRGRSGKRSDQDKYQKNWLEMKGAAEEDGEEEKAGVEIQAWTGSREGAGSVFKGEMLVKEFLLLWP